MNKESVPSQLKYCAANYYRNNLMKGSAVILACIAVIIFAAGPGKALRMAMPCVCLFVFFLIFYGSFCLKARKTFSEVIISEKGILIKHPSGQQFNIPWDDRISAGSYYAEMNVSVSGGSHYELILSSDPPSNAYKVDHIEQFSVEKYEKHHTWRVSLGRGTRKWCEREATKIIAIKDSVLE